MVNSKEHREYLIKGRQKKKCQKNPDDHDESEEVYKCDKCTRHFHKKGVLNWHMKKIHEGLKNFKCESCDTGFALKVDSRST